MRHVCSYVKYMSLGTCHCRKQAHCQVFQLYETMTVRDKYTDCSRGVSDSQHSQQAFFKTIKWWLEWLWFHMSLSLRVCFCLSCLKLYFQTGRVSSRSETFLSLSLLQLIFCVCTILFPPFRTGNICSFIYSNNEN